jgi:hypothetical protein
VDGNKDSAVVDPVDHRMTGFDFTELSARESD